MTRAIPLLLVLGFLVYCLVDCFQAPEERVRIMPKVLWVILILIVPVLGGLAWLVAGRPTGGAAGRPGRNQGLGGGRPGGGRPMAPDDDDDFLRGLG